MGGLKIPYSEMISVPSVSDEMLSSGSRLLFDIAKSEGLMIEPVSNEMRTHVKTAACKTKDVTDLSETDIDVLAKALEYKETCFLLTDDFAVQNVASFLGIKIHPVSQASIQDEIIWQRQCVGCFRHFRDGEMCPVCGSALRKKMKKKKSLLKNGKNPVSSFEKSSYNHDLCLNSLSKLFKKKQKP